MMKLPIVVPDTQSFHEILCDFRKSDGSRIPFDEVSDLAMFIAEQVEVWFTPQQGDQDER